MSYGMHMYASTGAIESVRGLVESIDRVRANYLATPGAVRCFFFLSILRPTKRRLSVTDHYAYRRTWIFVSLIKGHLAPVGSRATRSLSTPCANIRNIQDNILHIYKNITVFSFIEPSIVSRSRGGRNYFFEYSLRHSPSLVVNLIAAKIFGNTLLSTTAAAATRIVRSNYSPIIEEPLVSGD